MKLLKILNTTNLFCTIEMFLCPSSRMNLLKSDRNMVIKGVLRSYMIINDLSIEDLIPDTETIVTITNQGYIKRTPLSFFSSQKRGGKGKSASQSKGEDFIENLLVTTNHSKILFLQILGKSTF